jgi:hypothetical protein
MAKALHLPFDLSDTKRVGKNLFRKQVLPVGKIEHEGETLDFTASYLDELVTNFSAGAFDAVPFLLADKDNRHTQDPEKYRGEIKSLDRGADGLYATIELSDDGAALVESNPKLGVSARLIEDLEKGGKQVGRAVQHVLGTLDPVVTGMKPWEAVELSEQASTPVTDLTGEKFSASVGKLSDSERATLRDLAARATGSDDPSDAELERVLARIVAESDSTDPPAAQLTAAQREAIELANRRASDAERQVRDLAASIATERFERQRDELLEAGVPPAIVDLAAPVLRGEKKVVELSNGTKIDAGDTVEKILRECKGMIDFSVIGRGSGHDGSEEAEAKRMADEWAKAGS